MTLLERINKSLKDITQRKDERKIPAIIVSHGHERKIPSIIVSHGWDRSIADLNESHIQSWSSGSPSRVDEDLLKEHQSTRTPEDVSEIRTYVHGGLDAGHQTGSRALNYHLLHAHEKIYRLHQVSV